MGADPNFLKKLKSFGGVFFEWKDENKKGRQVGLIGQEVQKVIHELTSTDEKSKEKYIAISYSNFSALLIEGIKARQTEIKEQQKQIEELKAKQIKLEKEISSILKLMPKK